jgi:hypothetical protein
MRGIDSLAWKQLLDIVCHHSLEPGNSIRAGKPDYAAIPGLPKHGGAMTGSLIELAMI